MSKKHLIFSGLMIASSFNMAFASEYLNRFNLANAGTIHTIKIIKGWCGNLAISTKVGYIENGSCHYQKETIPYGYDGCTQYLNGGLLEQKVGRGYQCAATHIKSNVNGSEAVDEFRLNLDKDGHYIGTQPPYSEIELKN